MSQVLDKERLFEADYQRVAASQAPAWLAQVRQEAFQKFQAQGWPTPHEEAWRFTNLAPLAAASLALPDPNRAPLMVRPDSLDLPIRTLGRVVFVDGRFRPDLSRLPAASEGIQVMNLAQALQRYPDLVRTNLAIQMDQAREPFTALNSALMEDGLFVHVGRSHESPLPLELVHLAGAGASGTMFHPRNLLILDEAASLSLIERHLALAENVYLANTVTQAVLGSESRLCHLYLERESPAAFVVSTLLSRQETSSRLQAHAVLLGGALVRHNIHAQLAGEEADLLINGIYAATGRQHMDNQMRVVHAAAHCHSRQNFHGILDGRARGVFTGRIVVNPGAQKTDAKQSCRNLLLSQEAQVNTQPQLEIYADDVKCTHGATTGQVDPEAIFYLRSRGIPEAAARSILIYAFAQEALDRVEDPNLRAVLARPVLESLPHGEMLGKLLEDGLRGELVR